MVARLRDSEDLVVEQRVELRNMVARLRDSEDLVGHSH
jgi:hypothetical protein